MVFRGIQFENSYEVPLKYTLSLPESVDLIGLSQPYKKFHYDLQPGEKFTSLIYHHYSKRFKSLWDIDISN